MAETVTVGLGSRAYPVHIGRDLLSAAPSFLPFDVAGRSLFILADQNVTAAADMLCDALQGAAPRRLERLSLPGGEGTKSLGNLEKVLDWLLGARADRKSILFAVGGGVLGDLAGFAAAITLRGIGFVQVPTTLLAQVDSSVGGKTGINAPQGKNLIGAFHQPLAVLADLGTLETLPRREWLAGYAEIAKYGLIDDEPFFHWLEVNGANVVAGAPAELAQAIATSCRKKSAVVEADEREQGARALLNLGHTFGHALEASCGYDGRLLHGEAVAIGMSLAFETSAALGFCPEDDARRVIGHLDNIGLPTTIRQISPRLEVDENTLLGLMEGDKKAAGGKPVFILARGIGRSFLCYDADLEIVRRVVARSAAA